MPQLPETIEEQLENVSDMVIATMMMVDKVFIKMTNLVRLKQIYSQSFHLHQLTLILETHLKQFSTWKQQYDLSLHVQYSCLDPDIYYNH